MSVPVLIVSTDHHFKEALIAAAAEKGLVLSRDFAFVEFVEDIDHDMADDGLRVVYLAEPSIYEVLKEEMAAVRQVLPPDVIIASSNHNSTTAQPPICDIYVPMLESEGLYHRLLRLMTSHRYAEHQPPPGESRHDDHDDSSAA